MATVNVMFDTDEQVPVLTIDGQKMENVEFYVSCYYDYDGNKNLSFEYSTNVENEQGLQERKTYRLPHKDEETEASFVEADNNQLIKDIKDFFTKK